MLFYIACLLNEERSLHFNTKTDKTEEYIRTALHYIERNYNQNDILTLEAIADYIHLTPIYLNRFFKQKVGSPLHKYITYYRILIT